MIVVVVGFALLFIVAIVFGKLSYDPPQYKVYISKDSERGKLKIGVQRVKAASFPVDARSKLEEDYFLLNGHSWTPVAKYARTALIDPEDDDADNLLAEAIGNARSLCEQWSKSDRLEELHATAQRMLKE